MHAGRLTGFYNGPMTPSERPAPQRAVSRVASFAHAWRGLRLFVAQPNARIHLAAAALVVALGAWLRVSNLEWVALVLAMELVMGAEALNTALEYAVDLASPEWHPLARDAKDVAAAAVLICSAGALVVGGLVFMPHLLARL